MTDRDQQQNEGASPFTTKTSPIPTRPPAATEDEIRKEYYISTDDDVRNNYYKGLVVAGVCAIAFGLLYPSAEGYSGVVNLDRLFLKLFAGVVGTGMAIAGLLSVHATAIIRRLDTLSNRDDR